jgi:hypothetical protein
MKGNIAIYNCRFTKGGLLCHCKASYNSKWELRASLDRAIAAAREISESDRTAKEKYLAQELIYFADDQGDFDEEKVYLEAVSFGRKMEMEMDELSLLKEMRTPTPDTSIASIRLRPSLAISTLLQSQYAIFGSANVEESSLLLTRLDPIKLDALATHAEIEIKVNQFAETDMKKVIADTCFDLEHSMADCRSDRSMEVLVKELVGEGFGEGTAGIYPNGKTTRKPLFEWL